MRYMETINLRKCQLGSIDYRGSTRQMHLTYTGGDLRIIDSAGLCLARRALDGAEWTTNTDPDYIAEQITEATWEVDAFMAEEESKWIGATEYVKFLRDNPGNHAAKVRCYGGWVGQVTRRAVGDGLIETWGSRESSVSTASVERSGCDYRIEG